MKPIEKGCLAIVVRCGSDLGAVVTVGEYIGKVLHWDGCNHWEVDKSMLSTKGNRVFHIDEYYLMRIDGYKEEETEKLEAVV